MDLAAEGGLGFVVEKDAGLARQTSGALTSARVAITATGSELLHLSPASKLQ